MRCRQRGRRLAGTVSNALNHPDKLKPSTLDAVRQAMSRLGFMPNQSARMLAGGRNASFGLVLPRHDGFSLQIANGATARPAATDTAC